MNILIIPEDPRNDQYILKPVFERLFQSIGKPKAHIRICIDPIFGGVGEALKIERLREIVARYDGMTDIFILCIDRDGDISRRIRLDQIEKVFKKPTSFIGANAWE